MKYIFSILITLLSITILGFFLYIKTEKSAANNDTLINLCCSLEQHFIDSNEIHHSNTTFIIDTINNIIYDIDMYPLQGEIYENKIIIRDNQDDKTLINHSEYVIDRLSGHIKGTRAFGVKGNMGILLIEGTCSKVTDKKF